MYDVWNGRVEVERWRDVGEWKGSERREMKNANIENLVAKIRQIAYDLHVYLGNGFLEKVYANGLVHRLRKAGFLVEVQKPLRVFDSDGFCLGEYFADLVVEGLVVVELKAVQSIANEHYAQILNYLKITGAPAGLLINFGSFKFEVRTVIPHSAPSTPLSNTPTPTTTSTSLHFYTAKTPHPILSSRLHFPSDFSAFSTTFSPSRNSALRARHSSPCRPRRCRLCRSAA